MPAADQDRWLGPGSHAEIPALTTAVSVRFSAAAGSSHSAAPGNDARRMAMDGRRRRCAQGSLLGSHEDHSRAQAQTAPGKEKLNEV